MYIYNITFIVAPPQEKELIDYIRRTLLPEIFNEESPAKNPELRKVIEAGGEKPEPDHGTSVALSTEFESDGLAHLWHDHILIPALGEFHFKFGQNALFFITMLETIEL